ncbi:MAG: PEP/pyruvate-binding domain-containing protein, partial [Chloroflexota bacterium]
MIERYLLTLDEINIDDLHLVGNKALSLATLYRNQLNVPPSLIVSCTFFEAQIDHFSYRPIWAGSPDVAVTESSLEFLADFLKSTPLAPALDQHLKEKIATTFPEKIKSFAVRSSALDEDQVDHSFAGTYLTELDVPRDLLTVSLTRCWASALAGKSIQYRLQHGISIQQIKIAILIQPYVQADTAGVGFTLNPVTGARDELVLEAANAPGEAIVSSTLTPYRYHLERYPPAYPVLKKLPGDTLNLGKEPVSDEQLTHIALTLERIEAIMGKPQDVEWLYRENQLFILQTRPITTTIQTQTQFFDTEWIRANYRQAIPELPSPLFLSLMKRNQDRGFRFFNNLGLDVSGVGPYLTEIYGRPYLNLSLLKRMLAQLGFDSLGMMVSSGYIYHKPGEMGRLRFDWRTVWQSRRIYFNLFLQMVSLPQIIKHYQKMSVCLVSGLQKDES